MKQKTFIIMLSVVLALGITGCGNNRADSDEFVYSMVCRVEDENGTLVIRFRLEDDQVAELYAETTWTSENADADYTHWQRLTGDDDNITISRSGNALTTTHRVNRENAGDTFFVEYFNLSESQIEPHFVLMENGTCETA